MVIDERLKERGVGDISGLTGEEIQASFPGFLERWRGLEKIIVPPGGEDPHLFTQRVSQAFADITARHPQETVAVVTHGGVLGIYMGHLLGVPAGRWAPFSFGNGSLSVVEIGEHNSLRIKMLNDCCHLEREGLL